MNSYKRSRSHVILLLLGLSLLAHGLILTGLWWVSLELESKEASLEIAPEELMELAYDPELVRQFVPRILDNRPVEEDPSEDPKPTRFASEKRVRVENERRAALKDFDSPSSNKADRQQTQTAKQEFKPSFWGMVTPEDPKVQFGPASSLEIPRTSSISVDLPRDIAIGAITVLNTDPLLHFSFFDRLNRLSYHHWVREVTSSYQRRLFRGQIVRNGRYSTVIEVVLDREGRLVETLLQNRSGFEDFDVAYPKALRTAGQIPNPPKEMIEEDGLVRFKLLVTVNVEGQYHSRN